MLPFPLPQILTAAGQFASKYVSQRLNGEIAKKKVEQAYNNAAESTIEACEQRGYAPRSQVWNELVDLLGNYSRLSDLIERLRRGAIPGEHDPLESISEPAAQLVVIFSEKLSESLRQLLS